MGKSTFVNGPPVPEEEDDDDYGEEGYGEEDYGDEEEESPIKAGEEKQGLASQRGSARSKGSKGSKTIGPFNSI
jgi:hypothetical protein